MLQLGYGSITHVGVTPSQLCLQKAERRALEGSFDWRKLLIGEEHSVLPLQTVAKSTISVQVSPFDIVISDQSASTDLCIRLTRSIALPPGTDLAAISRNALLDGNL